MTRGRVWALLLSACHIDPSPFGPLGGVATCVDGPAPVDPPTSSVTVAQEVGAVVEVVAGLSGLSGPTPYGDCAYAPVEGVTVRLRDDLGRDWALGLAAWSGEDDRTPALGLSPGDEVHWGVVDVRDFGWSAASYLFDASGVRWAADTGAYDTLSMAPDVEVPGPQVAAGAAIGPVERGACGTRRRVELEVTGDDGVAVGLDVWEEGQVTVDGVALEARNAGAWRFVGDVRCTDAWGPTPWLVWRP
jgi:hypothetical protein